MLLIVRIAIPFGGRRVARLASRLGKLGQFLRDVGARTAPPAIQLGFLELDPLRKPLPVSLAPKAEAQGVRYATQYLRCDSCAADGVACA